jgi:hypothetical protein
MVSSRSCGMADLANLKSVVSGVALVGVPEVLLCARAGRPMPEHRSLGAGPTKR